MSRPGTCARFLAPLFAAALLAALSACSVNPAGRQSFTGLMSPAQEMQIGREEHPKILKQFGGVYEDARLDGYVASLGAGLASRSERADLRFTFTVLNSDDVNAFALPGGYVYVTRGLIALAGSEAELAGVIAHEIGHVTARHTAERYSQSIAVGLGAAVLGAVVGAPGVGDLANLGSELYLRSFSRDQELEADTLGIRYLTRAGFDANAMSSFLSKLRDSSRLQAVIDGRPAADADKVDFFATHPRTIERVEKAAALAAQQAPGARRVGRVEFLTHIDGLSYGGDPEQGFIRGRAFIHPKLRFRFTVPPGFHLTNRPQAVIAEGPQDSRIVFNLAPKRYTGAMTRYLAENAPRGVAFGRVETLDINDFDGATVEGRTSDGARDVRLVAARDTPDKIYRFVFVTPPALTRSLAVELRRTTYSLKRLSEAEARNERPLRIHVQAVKAGDTVAGLARNMPFEDFREERFRVLNGLGAHDEPAPGTLVKTIVE